MKRLSKFGLFIVPIVLLFLSSIMMNSEEIPKAQLPVLTTSAGQSPDVTTVNIICEEAGVKYDYCDVVTVEMIEDGVGLGGKKSGPGFHVEVHTDLNKFPKGTPYKTIVIAIGASLKGMGASGLTVETELNRLKRIIEYCKKKGIFIIGVHIGGSSKRGAPGSDNERMIDAVAPYADYLIVTSDSNKDGRFTNIAKEKGTPLTEVEFALDVVEIFKQVFQTN
jgi:PPE-repeat protein